MDRNEYLEIVSAQVRCKRAVPYLKGELSDHIEDQKEAYIAAGMNSFEAEMAAVREMGDPVETGVQLDRVHRPKIEWKVLAGAIVLGLIGAALQIAIVVSVGNPNVIYETQKQAQLFLIGMIIMMGVCYVDYSILAKRAKILWWVLVALLFLSAVCELPILYRAVNGVNRTNRVIAYFMIPTYAAYVYGWRNRGRKGFLMSFLGLVLFAGFLAFGMPLGWVIKYSVITFAVFGYALFINWFKITKKDIKVMSKYGTCILAGFLISIIYEVIEYGYHDLNFVPAYYFERFKLFMGGNVTDYIAEEIKVFLRNGGNAYESQFLQEYMQNDYIWLFITTHLGKTTGIVLAIVFVIFMSLLIHKVYEQKNMLGKFVAYACAFLLIVEIIFYIGGNLGWTPFMGSFMPFLGAGKLVTIVTYFYMGILLSIFRNTNVVRN